MKNNFFLFKTLNRSTLSILIVAILSVISVHIYQTSKESIDKTSITTPAQSFQVLGEQNEQSTKDNLIETHEDFDNQDNKDIFISEDISELDSDTIINKLEALDTQRKSTLGLLEILNILESKDYLDELKSIVF